MTPQGKRVAGIIAEYNPFHNGHLYHIQEAKKHFGCDSLIVVMSGNYVQRGTPAIFDKYTRARFALEAGADAVLELPAALSCGSAEFFARGAVGLLHRLGIVDVLCFGCEDTDLTSLRQLAGLLTEEPPTYKEALTRLLRQGMGYPAARQNALSGLLPAETIALLAKPNNLLAIEYLKALSFFSSPIKPLPVQRIGDGYHQTMLPLAGQEAASANADEETVRFPSATALRKQIFTMLPEIGQEPDSGQGQFPEHGQPSWNQRHFLSEADLVQKKATLQPYLPDFVYQKLLTDFYPIQEDDFSSVLFYALQPYTSRSKQERIASLTLYQDVSPELAGRLLSCLHRPCSFSSLAAQLSSATYTASRSRRALLHLLLGITVQDMELFRSFSYAPYARLLGIRKESGQLLRSVSEKRRIPVITKAADAKQILTPEALHLFEQDIAAAELYNQIVFCRYGMAIPSDYYHPFLVL